ncbi:hypothetical protein NDN08_000614 [Rhodosorus marinus]|uniref:Gem-associated protein 7 n=1 Tax=Rhodosorus marinus TaxID=101924 RepID=A0AAV8UNG7_9RHOD|nr:hypothetical protein NDN08_000614 [Rhodosorus marinus]
MEDDERVRAAKMRLRFLNALRAVEGRTASVEMVDGTMFKDVKLVAVGGDSSPPVLVDNLDTVLGVLPHAILRWTDIATVTVSVREREDLNS